MTEKEQGSTGADSALCLLVTTVRRHRPRGRGPACCSACMGPALWREMREPTPLTSCAATGRAGSQLQPQRPCDARAHTPGVLPGLRLAQDTPLSSALTPGLAEAAPGSTEHTGTQGRVWQPTRQRRGPPGPLQPRHPSQTCLSRGAALPPLHRLRPKVLSCAPRQTCSEPGEGKAAAGRGRGGPGLLRAWGALRA